MLEKIIDMPKYLFFSTKVPRQPAAEVAFCPADIKVLASQKGCLAQLAHHEIMPFLQIHNKDIKAAVVSGHES